MAIPVQSDFWGQIGTNGLESLLDGQLQPWGGGSSSAGIKPVHLAALKMCRSGMAEGWIWPQGCAHLAAAVVLLGDRAACQLPSHLLHLCGGPEVAGSCRSVSELSSRARQVPDKPGLPAGTEGFYCCQYKGKKDASLLFFQICGDIVQTVPECSLCQNKHHLQMLWFCKKPQEEKLSDFTFTRVQKPRASRQQQLLGSRSFTTPGVLLVPVWCEGTKPSEDTTVECWTWAQVMLTDWGWAVSPFHPKQPPPSPRAHLAFPSRFR